MQSFTPHPASAKVRRVQVHAVRVNTSGTWDREASFAAAAAASGIPAAELELDVFAIGGGASGWAGVNGVTGNGDGGNPGSVNVLRGLRQADLPATVSLTVGAGGAATALGTGTIFSISNPGSATAFGALVTAPGGLGSNGQVENAFSAYKTLQGSTVALGEPGSAARSSSSAAGNAGPSNGPGAGGGGAAGNGSAPFMPGGSGGACNADSPALTQAGGAAGAGNAGAGNPGSAGKNGTQPGQYGSGGGGGGASGTNISPGGAGGFPGGGGGGGASQNGTKAGAGGAGGNGCIDLFYFKRVA